MPKLEFTAAELKAYFTGDAHSFIRDEAIEMENDIRVHADGLYPEKAIEEARPNESEEVQEYRKSIWKPKTKATFSKVLNSLSKIRRSADWSIQWPSESFDRIPDGESLQDYTELNLPHFQSLTNWAFDVLLREMLIDPNAVVIMLPFDEMIDDPTAFVRPYPHIINSSHVVDFVENDFAILENPVGTTYQDVDGAWKDGKSFFVATVETIFRYDQTGDDGKMELVWNYDHMSGELPVEKIKGILKTVKGGSDFLYESRIGAMIPELDEAAREYSDLQASKVMHLYPERWEITTHECDTCNGTGKVAGGVGEIACEDCHGTGDAPSPFSKLLVRRGIPGETAVPIPPAGFVEKDVRILELMEKSVDKHLFDALAAVNMQFLDKTPLAESGRAKEVDADETNNFVHSVGEDLIRVMDWNYRTMAQWRYKFQYPNDDDIRAMVPTVPVPQHFDLFSTEVVETGFNSAKEKKWNPTMVSHMEKSLAAKKFTNTDDGVILELNLVLDLDPLANVDQDDKMTMLSNKGIAPIDYVISCNINQFIRRALRENPEFGELEYDAQRAVLEKYAQTVIDATEPKVKNILTDVLENGNQAAGDGSQGNQNQNPDGSSAAAGDGSNAAGNAFGDNQ